LAAWRKASFFWQNADFRPPKSQIQVIAFYAALSFSFATIISAANVFYSEKIEYPGLILTTIMLTDLPDGKSFEDLQDGDEVFFKEFSENGSNGTFLADIVETDKTLFGTRTFKAKYVSPMAAYKLAKRGYTTTRSLGDPYWFPLFCVHGFTVQPSDLFQTMAKAYKLFLDGMIHLYPIPVLWSTGKLRLHSYLQDQSGSSLEAGRLILNSFPHEIFIEKSLMTHSMGNHAVLNCALGLDEETPDARFDNIYMVAAVSTISITRNELSLC